MWCDVTGWSSPHYSALSHQLTRLRTLPWGLPLGPGQGSISEWLDDHPLLELAEVPEGQEDPSAHRTIRDGAARPVTPGALPARGLRAHDPAWSPSGDRVAFVRRSDGESSLGLLDPANPSSGVTWILDRRDGAWIGPPRWSVDGRWLVFAMHRGGRRDLWAIGRGGSDLRPLTWDEAKPIMLSPLATSNRSILFSCSRSRAI